MTLNIQLAPLISLGAGIAILVFPKLLNYCLLYTSPSPRD